MIDHIFAAMGREKLDVTAATYSPDDEVLLLMSGGG
jgi:hypothetical protein